MKNLRMNGRWLFCFFLVVVLSLTGLCEAQDSPDSVGVTKAEFDSLVLQVQQIEKGDLPNIGRILPIVLLALLAVIIFLGFAHFSRRAIFNEVDDRGRLAEFAMKQTFGLPQGTVRGIMAILVAVIFLGSIFVFKDIPESVKIITSLVFGYYFAKSSDQTKDVMEAMLGKTSQRAVRKQAARQAIAEARADGADTFAGQALEAAKNHVDEGDGKQVATEAIACYDKAIEVAKEAQAQAIQAQQEAADAEEKERERQEEGNQTKFNDLSRQTRRRIDALIALDIDHRATLELWEAAEGQAEAGNTEGANQMLERVEDMVNVLLKEYDEAQEIYEQRLAEEQKAELKVAKENLDGDESLSEAGVDGSQMVESLFSAMASLKDKDPGLVPLFRKRVMGENLEQSDLKQIFETMVEEGKTKAFKNVVDIAANAAGKLLPDSFRENLEKLKLYEKLIVGNDNQLSRIFDEYFADGVEEKDFATFVQKVRKNIVDGQIGDLVKNALPKGLQFDQYKQALKRIQNDVGGKGALGSIQNILNVGETILGFTPLGGAAKVVGAIGRGIFKIF